MNMKAFFVSFMLLTSLLCVLSCHKTSDEATQLMIDKPLGDDNFSGGDTIKIKGGATNVAGLHTLTIKITDDKTNEVLFTTSPNVLNLNTYNFSIVWKAKVSDWTDATVTVVAEDHAKVQTTKTVKIKIWL